MVLTLNDSQSFDYSVLGDNTQYYSIFISNILHFNVFKHFLQALHTPIHGKGRDSLL
jgi:hypothetical protein